MTIIHLVLKGKWYDMIQSGEKKEEYREYKPYWIKRFNKPHYQIDHVIFHRGYTNKRTMLFRVKFIGRGNGRPEWGAEPDKEYLVIRLGEKILDVNKK